MTVPRGTAAMRAILCRTTLPARAARSLHGIRSASRRWPASAAFDLPGVRADSRAHERGMQGRPDSAGHRARKFVGDSSPSTCNRYYGRSAAARDARHRLESCGRTETREVGLLHDVFGVLLVARQPARRLYAASRCGKATRSNSVRRSFSSNGQLSVKSRLLISLPTSGGFYSPDPV